MFKNQLKKLREGKGISQAKLAKDLGLSASTIGMYESGLREPKDYETLELIADYFNVNIDLLLGGNKKPTLIPVYGDVRAGSPSEIFEEIIGYEEITEAMSKTGEHFALRVKGNSMEPRFCEGDVVIVRRQADCDNGDTAIVLVNGDESTIKKIQKFEGGVHLIPLNPTFPVLTYTNEQIAQLPIAILGKVVELRAKF